MGTYQERVKELYCSTQFLPAYRAGFAEAREGAEQIAAEADARIAELEAELGGMVAAVELAAREEAAARRDAAYWRKRGYDAEAVLAAPATGSGDGGGGE